MNIAQNICPVCKEVNQPDAAFCKHCGAALEASSLDPGVRTKETNFQITVPGSLKDWSVDEAAVPENGIAVYIEGEFNPVHIDSGEEFVIGRKAGTTSSTSDSLLDLSPLGGYGQGVSRRHAAIRHTKEGYQILDLGSVNGTWLNDIRMAPHQYRPLPNRSYVRVGGMRLFVLYHPHPEAEQGS